MSDLATAVLLILFILAGDATVSAAAGDDEFFKRCPTSRCGGLEIRYPLRLSSASPSCGQSDLEFNLSCSSNTTILTLSSFGPYAVSAIDYNRSIISATPIGPPPPCPFRNLSAFGGGVGFNGVSVLNCTVNLTATLGAAIPCLTDANHFGYLVLATDSMERLPSSCEAVTAGVQIPMYLGNEMVDFGESVEVLVERRNLSLSWSQGSYLNHRCQNCEFAGEICGFSFERDEAFCLNSDISPPHHGSRTTLITGTCIGGILVLMLAVFIFVHTSKESVNEKETRERVERFLATYTTTKPTRYSFSGIKKITKNFKQKLGQGGFGSVYKGVLPNGIPVAVKMLEISRGKGEEFTNEVGTIGIIHHVNIVRLLGFCSEGTRRALVYEFMPNESLEKYISSKEGKLSGQVLSMEKFQDISLGIARGIEYLHQGCDQRILHFDIKPHNILLDHDLNPKISDFGLAKLCSKDISIVTMTAARGTMGYIAPEIYSRNFGSVSSKSDVYSFGMLLMDMAGGRDDVEPAIGNQESIYFPENVYNCLAHGQELKLSMDIEENQEEIAKKLLIVALWCIQWSPVDRPSMSKVVKMLMGNSQSLEMPPRPFASTSDQDSGASSFVSSFM